MEEFKVYVEVMAVHHTDGRIVPLSLRWKDGGVYDITKILDVREAASMKAGGFGLRYTCRIEGRDRFLFYGAGLDAGKWFMEAKRNKA